MIKLKQHYSTLPPEFDSKSYRHLNADLSNKNEQELFDHWLSYGMKEGRQANTLNNRSDFSQLVYQFYSPSECLEISPFSSPLLTNVDTKYCDVLSYEELITRAESLGIENQFIPKPNYVFSKKTSLGDIKERFGAVLSSHVIEHQPNLVQHFIDINKILKQGGRYFVLVPDSRYCFDLYIGISNLAEIIAAHYEKRTKHTTQSVLEHRVVTTHNDCIRHWNGDHGEQFSNLKSRIISAREEYVNSKESYIDVHSWQFTPESFKSNLEAIFEIFDLPLIIERVYVTRRNTNEFWSVIKKSK